MRFARQTRRSRGLVLVAAVTTAVSLLAGCGSSGSDDASSGAGDTAEPSGGLPDAFPVTIQAGNGSVTLDEQPEKIVVLGPTLTETVYAIGAGTQVVAVDESSNYPAEAPEAQISAFQPNAEAVSAFKPDLVLTTGDANGLVKALDTLKIKVLVLPAPKDLNGAYEQMVTIGRATGHEDDAKKVSEEVKSRVAKAVAGVSAAAKGKKVYHELDQTYYSLTSATFIGDVYKQFGLTNIADAAKDAVSTGGYPQLSAEYILSQAPDLVVLGDTKCCQQSAATVAKRPGFANLPAVKNGTVLAADDDIASRWGPRVADFAESVSTELGKLK